MRHVVFFMGCVLLAVGSLAVAQETTGALQGNVATDVGTPVAGAIVEANGPVGRVTATSAEDGRYRFARLSPGNYQVVSNFEGYVSPEIDVRVILGEAVTVDFTLQQSTFEDEIQVYSDTVVIDFTEARPRPVSVKGKLTICRAAAASPRLSPSRPARSTTTRAAAS